MTRTYASLWWFAAALAALAAVAVLLRAAPVEPIPLAAESPSVSTYDAVIHDAMTALRADPRGREARTRALVNRVAGLAASGDVTTAETWFALGQARRRQEDYPAAEEAYRRAIELRPDWAQPHCGLGILLYRMGRADPAEFHFRRAITLDPSWSRPRNDLIVLLRIEGRYDEALREARDVLAIAPDDVTTQNAWGNLLVVLERYDEAEAAYRKAILLDPDEPAPLYNLACLAALEGRVSDALPPLKRAIAMNPAFRDAARSDPDFDRIRNEAGFGQLVQPGGDDG